MGVREAIRRYEQSDVRFLLILIALVYQVLISPVLPSNSLRTTAILNAVAISFVAIAGMLSTRREDGPAGGIGLVLGFGVPVLAWIELFFDPERVFGPITLVWVLLFYMYWVIRLIDVLLRSPRVTPDVLFGAICGYMALGIIGSYLLRVLRRGGPDCQVHVRQSPHDVR